MEGDGPDTRKTPHIDSANELEYVKDKYNEAMDAYIKHPSYENRKKFLDANQKYMEVRYAYLKGAELLIQYYAKFRGTWWLSSQK